MEGTPRFKPCNVLSVVVSLDSVATERLQCFRRKAVSKSRGQFFSSIRQPLKEVTMTLTEESLEKWWAEIPYEDAIQEGTWRYQPGYGVKRHLPGNWFHMHTQYEYIYIYIYII